MNIYILLSILINLMKEELLISFKKYFDFIYIYTHSPTTLLGTPVQLLGNTNC